MASILIAGDFCPRDRVSDLINKGQTAGILQDAENAIHNVDYAIVNLESPVANESNTPILKCGPNLMCTSKSLCFLKKTGFNMVTLANNHIKDYGEEGIRNTIQCCKELGLDYVGAGINVEEASLTKYLLIKHKRVAIINCCEHEFSIASDNESGSNPLNPINQFYAIKRAKETADYVVVIVHGGHEHYQLPSPRMTETYRFFIDVGADAVINHHQHCYSGYEIYNKKPIFYGLGNFCFDGNRNGGNLFWNEGFLVVLQLDEQVGFQIIPYLQCLDTPQVKFLSKEKLEEFRMKIQELNEAIQDKEQIVRTHDEFLKTYVPLFSNLLSPYSNRFLLSLMKRKLVPSFFGLNKLIKLKNYIECESHIEKFRAAINLMISQSKK